jgi:hypothetical protein
VSAETQLRAALLAHAPLVAVVPAASISIDAVLPTAARPYIAFSKQSTTRDLGLGNALLGTTTTLDVQCIGNSRAQAIQVAELVVAALDAAGQPSEQASAGYDADNDIEAEVVTVNWITV